MYLEHEALKTRVKSLEQKDKENTELISRQRQELEGICIRPFLKYCSGKVYNNITRSRSTEANHLSSRYELTALSALNQRNVFGQLHQKRTRRFIMEGTHTVAFHATFSEDRILDNLTVGSTIPFTNVKLNVGGGYLPSTSLFIAPIGGIYMFSTSVMSGWQGFHDIHVGIMKNNTYLAGAYAADDGKGAEQGSVTVVTQLAIGDQVWVKHMVHEHASVYGGSLTSFMGCLITHL